MERWAAGRIVVHSSVRTDKRKNPKKILTLLNNEEKEGQIREEGTKKGLELWRISGEKGDRNHKMENPCPSSSISNGYGFKKTSGDLICPLTCGVFGSKKLVEGKTGGDCWR